jgi:hypothetical protein
MQNGNIIRSERRRGPGVWEYRWRGPGAPRRDINRACARYKGKPVTLSQLADRYGQRELAASNRWMSHSTQMGYRGYLRK